MSNLERILEGSPIDETAWIEIADFCAWLHVDRHWVASLVEAGVTVIFNYTEQLLQVPPEVTVHTSSPAVDLLYALYFYLS